MKGHDLFSSIRTGLRSVFSEKKQKKFLAKKCLLILLITLKEKRCIWHRLIYPSIYGRKLYFKELIQQSDKAIWEL